jgi:DNA invertase Pin-like site-specific DNA recombinase
MAQTVAYLRVSTADQNTEKNKKEILLFTNDREFGNVDFFEETVSGKKSWKEREIKKIIDELDEGDRLIVPEMEILAIAREKGIHIYDIKGNWELNGSIQSKVMAMVFSIAAEIERDLISSRTKEALRARKAAGITLGRPKGPGK